MADTFDISIPLPSTSMMVGVAIALSALVSLGLGWVLPAIARNLVSWLRTEQDGSSVEANLRPYRILLSVVIALAMGEVAIIRDEQPWFFSELAVSLSLTLTASWLLSRLFRRYFDTVLLTAALKSGRKLNSEFLVLGKLLVNLAIGVLAVFIYAQAHAINVAGLLASLGIGGIAIAFASQKTLEQLLGGIVLLIDRPFVIDDYIGLSDGTFGRVESIGLRSTKIRTSGKGTLMVIPNSSLSQSTIENFSGAKKLMSLLYLNFYRAVSEEERALIRQIILECTKNVFGLDPKSTNITFREQGDINGRQGKVQAQCTFFILGSGQATMNLRRQLITVARQDIATQLQKFDIDFKIEDPAIYVNSPITI